MWASGRNAWRLRWDRNRSAGRGSGNRVRTVKRLLESDPFAKMTSVTAADGRLEIAAPDGDLQLELGAAAAKWARKILHPPQRLDKLGVKPASRVAVVGGFDQTFTAELSARVGKAPGLRRPRRIGFSSHLGGVSKRPR